LTLERFGGEYWDVEDGIAGIDYAVFDAFFGFPMANSDLLMTFRALGV
jgi:hypothetical protein